MAALKVVKGDFGKSIAALDFGFFDEMLRVRLEFELWLDLRLKIFKGDICFDGWWVEGDSVHSEDAESRIKGILK